MFQKSYVFVSYHRSDHPTVSAIVRELRKLGVKTWVDAENLQAGASWEHEIARALQKASVLLVFMSEKSLQSVWVSKELELALQSGISVFPVVLSAVQPSSIPRSLRDKLWLDASSLTPEMAAAKIEEDLSRLQRSSWGIRKIPKASQETAGLARALTAQTKGAGAAPLDAREPDSLFVVHGHDDAFLHEVVTYIELLSIKPIVMKDVGGSARSLIDKFFEVGGAARFAIVLLSPDDFGASRFQYEEPNVGNIALRYRSRQNVILELGYFYGLLGWDKVFVLEKLPSMKFPDYERPSDLDGVIFDPFDASGKWKEKIRKRLIEHEFVLSDAED